MPVCNACRSSAAVKGIPASKLDTHPPSVAKRAPCPRAAACNNAKEIQKNGPRATTHAENTGENKGKYPANGKIPATFSGK